MPSTQENRSVSVSTPLGKDVLLFSSLRGHEELGRLFEFVLDVLSKNYNILANSLLGKSVTVQLRMSSGQLRFFNGYTTEFSQQPDSQNHASYRLVLRPWLWFLTRSTNCRIFQDKTVPDIVKDILRQDYGFTDLKENLVETYRKREYCVQYRETDFDFISRLMEEEGIYYFFSHQDGRHTLNLVDSDHAHVPEPGYESLPYFPPENITRRERDHIYAWVFKNAVQSGTYTLTDFDFEKPRANLMEKLSRPVDTEQGGHEQYDYPGGYTMNPDGRHYVKTRLQALQADYERFYGEANAFGLAVGASFRLTDHPREDQNQEYLVTGIDFRLQSNQYATGEYLNGSINEEQIAITAIVKNQPFRTAHSTPKPLVRGPQTAIVVGKVGEEIWTDKYGRVKVQFHWDRDGKRDENSSCWIRVSQPWSGKGWGAIAIPRIGQEVVVDFLEGNPDRPIITGSVYNSEQTVPYKLPANPTQSGIKSRSSKDGNPDQFNEIRLEDKKGQEEIYIHAEKDMNVIVENNHTLKIGADKKNPGDQTIDIHNNRSVTLAQGNDTLQIMQGDQAVQLDMGNCSLIVKTGNQETRIELGKSSTEAMQSIQFKVGQSSLVIDQTGVTIKGMLVKIEGTMQTEVKGTMTTVTGDATLTLKGGLVLIN